MEENDAGLQIDYVYLNGRPVAEILPSTGKVYYLHADRLGTPQIATDSGQIVVWSTTYQPFGQTAIPVGSISQSLRFPGQYADGGQGGIRVGSGTMCRVSGDMLKGIPLG
jgi:uncharacterized protein RhaS with RHS repeats